MNVNNRASYIMKMWGLARGREVNLSFPKPHHPTRGVTPPTPQSNNSLYTRMCFE